ncbi:hypothetical protein FZEAL_8320 [Fusarium zealandicum]|uniref:Uncharacterized protein n=1 Tax=Fusarium zealandicum TaxID=1053134 RepID=A0A8H4UEU3_9HYPO|nr:hypothetical protein FZEAL_8320 [Fusarium zealandicum]
MKERNLRIRARQLQRYADAPQTQPFFEQISPQDIARASLLEPHFSLLESPRNEREWPANWSTNRRSLRAFLASKCWRALPISEDPVTRPSVSVFGLFSAEAEPTFNEDRVADDEYYNDMDDMVMDDISEWDKVDEDDDGNRLEIDYPSSERSEEERRE